MQTLLFLALYCSVFCYLLLVSTQLNLNLWTIDSVPVLELLTHIVRVGKPRAQQLSNSVYSVSDPCIPHEPQGRTNTLPLTELIYRRVIFRCEHLSFCFV